MTFAAFHAALDNEFVNWDDPMFILENQGIKSLDWNHVRDFFSTFEVGAYTPLSRLSLAMDWAAWGNNPVGFHLTNLLLHCLNAILVFLIARKLYSFRISHSALPATPSGFIPHPSSLIPSLLAALLFSLHPLRVESVAWASERRDVLSGFFALACVLSWLRYMERQKTEGERLKDFLMSFFLFICAVISKPVAVTLPVAFIFLEIYLIRPNHSLNSVQTPDLKAFAWSIPFLLVSLATGLTLMSHLVESGKALDAQQVGWGARIAQAQVANMVYISKIALPIHLNPLVKLSGLYHFDQPIVWWGLLFNGAIPLLLMGLYRRFPSLLLSWMCYLVFILPFTGLGASGSQFIADRYTYLASAPLCILAGGAFQWGMGKGRVIIKRGLVLLTGVLLISWLWLTDRQVRVWKDSETLWVHSLKLDDANPIAWNNLGEALAEKKKTEQAIAALKQAVRWLPTYAEAWYNLGVEFNRAQHYADARRAYQQALHYNPSYAEAWHNIGVLDARARDWPSALKHYQMAQRLAPSAATEYNIGCCLRESGDTAAALQVLQSAAEGGFIEAWEDWADLLAQKGNIPQAIALLQEGVQRTGNSRVQLALVEMILRQKQPPPGNLSQARELLREVDQKTQGKSSRVQLLKAQLKMADKK